MGWFENIDQGNMIIAKFMECPMDEAVVIVGMRSYLYDQLKYHNSWDWLMPVIDKIGCIVYRNDNWQDSYSYWELYQQMYYKSERNTIMSTIVFVWEIVIQWIEWSKQKHL